MSSASRGCRRRGRSRGRIGRWLRLVAAAAIVGALTVSAAPDAEARPNAFVGLDSFVAEYVIQPDGSVAVTETLTAQFLGGSNRGLERVLVVEQNYPPKKSTNRVYRIEDIRARASSGYAADVKTSRNGSDLVIRIGDPDTSFGTATVTYTLEYRIIGALNHFEDRDEFYWNVTGDRWSGIESVSITQTAPGPISDAICFEGPAGSTQACASATITTPTTAEFTGGPLVREGLTTAIAFPAGLVTPPPAPILENRWSALFDSLGISLATVLGALVLSFLVVGGVTVTAVVIGRDRQIRGSTVDQVFVPGTEGQPEERVPFFRHREIPVAFVPPDGLRPGLLGTLVDERADTVDVTATMIDLAVRGYIRIVEAEPTGLIFKSPDWRLDRMRTDLDGLEPYESALILRLFPAGSTYTLLSKLKNTFADDMVAIRRTLLADATSRGWFRSNPERRRGAIRGFGVSIITFCTFGGWALTAFARIPYVFMLPLFVLGLSLTIAARFVPARTARGTAAFRQALGFRRFITESEKYRAEFAEREHLFTEYLGYAVAFGAVERWAKTFEGLELAPEDTSSWYWSSRPFSAIALGESLGSFATSSAGTLTSTPGGSGSSGFGGGGSSGGGGGGGGGGGW